MFATSIDISMMQAALLQARNAFDKGEVPVGAVICDASQTILAATHNHVETESKSFLHAELRAIDQASTALGHKWLNQCDLYVTLEPCAMCAGAISLARFRRVIFAAYDPKSGGVEHGARVFDHATCHHKPEVIGGVCEQEASLLLRDFFERKRHGMD
jgi:tRNA(adenine34) deaminase